MSLNKITFKSFYTERVILNERLVGRGPREDFTTPGRVYVFITPEDIITFNRNATAYPNQVATLEVDRNGAIRLINAASTDIRTKIMHLFRYKADDKQLKHQVDTVKRSSKYVANNLFNRLKTRILSRQGDIKIVYPESRSRFNNFIKNKINKYFPNVAVLELPKLQLKDISPDKLFPLIRLNPKLSPAEQKYQEIFHPVYESYRKLNPNEVFSRSTLSSNLRSYIESLVNQGKLTAVPNSNRNLDIHLDGKRICWDITKPAFNGIVKSHGLHRVSTNIVKSNLSPTFNVDGINAGDFVVAYDDNSSQEFTANNLKDSIQSKGAKWGGMYVGASFPIQENYTLNKVNENSSRFKYKVLFDGSKYETTAPSSKAAITQVLARIARKNLRPEFVAGFIGKNINKAKAVLTESTLFDKQLKMGIKVELEHTNDRKIAEKIARDHLAEDPHYYTKLKKAKL